METVVPKLAQQGPVTLALKKKDAAAALGVSVDYFDNHIRHELKAVRRGGLRLYSVRELEHWLEKTAELAVPAK